MKIKINNLNLNYLLVGEGFPILCLHGYSLDHKVMTGCLEPIFSQSDFKCQRIYIDLPGMGESEVDSTVNNADDMLDILVSFIEQIIPNQNFAISSESYGSYLARGLIKKLEKRVEGLLMICPCLIPLASDRNLTGLTSLEKNIELLNQLNEKERESFSDFASLHTDRVWRRYSNEVYQPKQRCPEFLEKFQKEGYAFSFHSNLIEVFEKPTLILAGKSDNRVGYKDAYDSLKFFSKASYIVLENSGHSLQIEQVEVFNAMVKNWIILLQN